MIITLAAITCGLLADVAIGIAEEWVHDAD